MSLISIKEPTKKNKLPELAIGIDLGTTNSLIAIYENESCKVLSQVKSIVAYAKDKILIGQEAEEEILNNKYKVISSTKRLMGKNYHDIQENDIKSLIKEECSKEIITYDIGDENNITPIQVSTSILEKLKSDAEKELSKIITHAVITVPAYFDEAARNATKLAAASVGINTLRLINEPTAAALAYGLDRNAKGMYLIYDLGGGTFDISLLKMSKGIFQVIASAGDNMLGGDDFDRLIANYFIDTYIKHNVSNETYRYLIIQARILKEQLSIKAEATISANIENKNYNFHLTKEKFDSLIENLIDRTIQILNKLLLEKNITKSDIDEVILVGGSTRIIQIQEKLAKIFGKLPLANIDPDKIVAIGASLQAANLTGKIDNLLIDILPLSLGIEMNGGLVERIIERNTAIPASVEQKFTTQVDNQNAIKFHIVQGERELAKDCRSLARFELQNISPMNAGLAKISVSFNVDSDGLLTVIAKDDLTGNKQEIAMKPTYGLSEVEIDKMLIDSMEHAKNDVINKLLIESKLNAENLIAKVSSDIESYGKFIDEENIALIQNYLKELEQQILQNDKNSIDEHRNKLEEAADILIQEKLKHYLEVFKGKKLSDVENILSS